MSWLLPGFLFGGLLIGLPIALHFLRSRPKVQVRFPTLRFLGETAIRDTSRHRLRRWLVLLMRCLIIGLLVAAFARPFWISASASRRQVMVIAIDNSMSMQTHGRWAQTRAWALQQLDLLKEGDQVAILSMFPAPTWLIPMTDDLVRVRTTLLVAEPGYEKTRYVPALQMADQALAANPATTKTLVWAADEQQLGWLGADFTKVLSPGVKIHFNETFPAPSRQAALVALRWSHDLNGAGLQVIVRLFAPQQAQRHLVVKAGNRVLAEQEVSLRAGDNKIDVRLAEMPDVEGVRVALDPDDLPADDAAWITWKKSNKGSVLLDHVEGADFMAHALQATRQLGPSELAVLTLPDKDWPVDSVAVIRDPAAFHSPRLEELNRFTGAGGSLWLFVDGSPEQTAWLKQNGIKVTERAAAPESTWHLRDWDPDHPTLGAFVGQSLLPLLEVEFYQGFDLEGDSLVPLANWPDGRVALAEWSKEGRRMLVAGFPLDRAATDWPTLPSFAPFVHQSVRWLGSFGASRSDWRVGEAIPLPAGAGVWHAIDAASSPADRTVSGTVRPDAPGLYTFTAGTTQKVFAVNIPPEESDLAPWPRPEQFLGLESSESAAKKPLPERGFLLSAENAENQQRLWWWLLAFVGVVIMAELALANRTAP